MTFSREGFTVRIQHSGSVAPAGIGIVLDDTHIVTCAHVVNTALGRGQREQSKPGMRVRVLVDFPMLGGSAGAPSRSCSVQVWVPPPLSGSSGGDVAGLVLVGDSLPRGAGPARLVNQDEVRDVAASVFGFPGNPPRQANGAWAELRLRGAVGGGVIQLDTSSESAVRAQPGYSGSPVVISHDGSDVVLGMLAVASDDSDFRDSYAIPVSEMARAWPDVVGRLTIAACPYRGLGSFTADDADVFVGREDEVRRLHQLVRRRPVVMVMGPSGAGKSSLVNAGLIPLLRDQGWAAGSFRPGGTPMDALARALAAMQTADRKPTVQEVGDWLDLIRSAGLTSAGARLALALGQPVLVHADQLEEILDPAACAPELTAEFLDVLLSAQAPDDDGLHLVGSLRADFWSELLEHPDAGAKLGEGSFGLSPMSTSRLEKVIAEPARASGVEYQPGLVTLIAKDSGGGHGLPLLEFALTRLWPHQRGGLIALAAYQGIGGVTGALKRHAEQAYQDLLEQFPDERIRRVMLALVRSRGGAAGATSRVVSRRRLGEDWVVARALAKQRLVVVAAGEGKGEATAQVAHEALIREWPRFTAWVNEDADFQRWLSSAEERVADGDLLSDTRLAEADRWLAERAEDVPSEVRQLIHDSKSEWSRRMTELQEARRRAEEAARFAEARRLAAAAELALTMRETSLQIPIALAVEALRMAPVVEADMAIRRAIRKAAQQTSRLDHPRHAAAAALSRDLTRSAFSSFDKSTRVLDVDTGAQISRWDQDGTVHVLAFSPDGTRVATGSDDHGARVFDAATGAEIARLDVDNRVAALAFSPDGTRVAAGTGERARSVASTARVFDATTGAEIVRLDHDCNVSAVAFSPDGTRLATGGGDRKVGTARVFDAATGAETVRLDHPGEVHAMVFNSDGTQVATAVGSKWGGPGSARVFDAATGTEIFRLDEDGTVRAVAFSPDDTRLAVAIGGPRSLQHSGSARVFEIATGVQIARLDHDSRVHAVAFSPDGSQVVTGSGVPVPDWGSARVFNATTGAEIARLDHDKDVTWVAFSPDGTRVATLTEDYDARVFRVGAGAEVCRLQHDDKVSWVAFSPDGTKVATSSYDHSARIFDTVTGAQIARMDHDDGVSWVAFSPDGTRVATGSNDHSARIFDAATGAQIVRMDHDAGVRVVAFSPDGTKIATASYATARVFDAVSGAEICRILHYPRRDENYTKVYAVAFSPDGTRLATGSGDSSGDDAGFVQVYNAATGKFINSRICGSLVTSIAFSPDGTRIAVGSSEWQNNGAGSAHVLNADTWAEISRLEHIGEVNAVAFSPDGTSVAIGCHAESLRSRGGGSARVFDAATGMETSHLDHDREVWAVAFSPDGTLVATGSDDHSARVFDTATGTEIARADHQGEVRAVAFSPNGDQVATGSWDGSARVWHTNHDLLIQQAMDALTRNLTQEEWRRYFRDEPYRKTRIDLP